MKNLNKLIATTLISTALVGTAGLVYAGNKDNHMDEVAAMNETSITMKKAVEIALATIPGVAKEAEFEVENGKSIWEIEVVNADKQVYELEIDATSGEVLKQELDDGKRRHKKHRKNRKHHEKG